MAKICGMTDCPMYNKPNPMLAPIASGKNPDIMILLDSPDIKDTHRIFTSESAKFLTEKLKAAEIMDGRAISIATAVRCYCDQNDMSESLRTKALKCCKNYFVEHTKKYPPKLIISFGGMALTQATKQKGVKKYQGTFYKNEELNCHVFPLYAPGYILRNQSHEETWNTGFNQIRNFIANGFTDQVETPKQRILEEVQSIKGLFTKQETLDGIAIDTETQGLDWTHPLFTCVSYSIAPTPDRGYQVFLFEECPEEEKDYSIKWNRKHKSKNVPVLVHVKRSKNFEEKLRELRWFLENDQIKKIMHNGNYDCHVFTALFKVSGRLLKWNHDKRAINIKGYNFDTQNAAQLYNENVYQQARLESLQFAFTDITDRYDSEEFKSQFDKADMLSVPKEAMTRYAGLDVCVTKAVSVKLQNYLSENKKLERYMTNMVMPTLETLRIMEQNGAYVDVVALEKATIDINALAEESHIKALDCIPKRIIEAHTKAGLKLTRNNLVKDTLYSPDGFKIEPINFTKSKEPSADQDTLKLLLDSVKSKKAQDFIHHFTNFKKYDKLAGTYLGGFKKARCCDGKIHTKFTTCLPVTGRVSSSKPNVTNIPNKGDAAAVIRRIISVPPGYKILKADASQAELRWMAHYAQERAMMKIFRDGIIDIHTATAQFVAGYSPEEWDKLDEPSQKMLRKQAKCVNFGLIYGMSVPGYVTYAKVVYNLMDMTQEIGQQHSDGFFGKYKDLRPFYDDITKFGQKHGYVESVLGRRRNLPELNSKNKGLFNQAVRQAVNFPIQSASSDTVLLAANEIIKMDLPKNDFKLILFIHDELVAVVREDCDIDKYARILRDNIENPPLKKLFGVELSVPLESEVEFGDNLNDCKEWKFS